MTKLNAIQELMREYHNDRRSRAALARVRKAAKALELSTEELLALEKHLYYRDPEGELYPAYKK